jgi:hypothetical protein
LRSQFANRLFIVHHEDTLVIVLKWSGRNAVVARAAGDILSCAQIKREHRSLARRAFQQEQTAMFLHNRIADGETEPRPGRLRGEVRIENFGA